MIRVVICKECPLQFQGVGKLSCMLPRCKYEQREKESTMPSKSLHFCNHFGCGELTRQKYCQFHADQHEEEEKQARSAYEKQRGSAKERGYDSRWQKYSKRFLSQPENQICKLHLDDGCAVVSECVDHIDPPDGPHDPRFWDKTNHQPACIHCNSVKGHRKIKGNYDMLSSAE